jgi:hypothetical protein
MEVPGLPPVTGGAAFWSASDVMDSPTDRMWNRPAASWALCMSRFAVGEFRAVVVDDPKKE